MKRIIKLLLITALIALFGTLLLSCGGPDGTYTDEFGECSYVFDDDIVFIESFDERIEYRYEIKKFDKIYYMYFYDKETGEEALDPVEYTAGDGFLLLDGVKYVKK